MSHLQEEGHSWKETKVRLTALSASELQLQKGFKNLEFTIRNGNFSGWKETGLEVVSKLTGTAAAAAKAYTGLLFAGNSAKVNVQVVDVVCDTVSGVQHGTKAFKSALANVTPWAIVVAAALDIVVHSCRFWISGDIEDWREFGWYCSRSITSASISGLAGWGGSSAGLAIGSAICPVGGTIAGAIIGGLIGSILAGTFCTKTFEKVWENPSQKKRKKLVLEAVNWFHFSFEDLQDPAVFNEKAINKEYRALAKRYHPDRPTGDLKKWNITQMHLGLLLALCDKKGTDKNEAIKIMKMIKL